MLRRIIADDLSEQEVNEIRLTHQIGTSIDLTVRRQMENRELRPKLQGLFRIMKTGK